MYKLRVAIKSGGKCISYYVFLTKNLPISDLLVPANRVGPVRPESSSLFLLTSPGHNSNKSKLGRFFFCRCPIVCISFYVFLTKDYVVIKLGKFVAFGEVVDKPNNTPDSQAQLANKHH